MLDINASILVLLETAKDQTTINLAVRIRETFMTAEMNWPAILRTFLVCKYILEVTFCFPIGLIQSYI